MLIEKITYTFYLQVTSLSFQE